MVQRVSRKRNILAKEMGILGIGEITVGTAAATDQLLGLSIDDNGTLIGVRIKISLVNQDNQQGTMCSAHAYLLVLDEN